MGDTETTDESLETSDDTEETTEESSESEESDDTSDSTETGTEEAKATEEPADDGTEPEIRKPLTNKEWAAKRIAARQNKTQQAVPDTKDDGTQEEENLTPEQKLVNEKVAEVLKPIMDSEAERELDNEINQFLNANPDFKAFEAKARRFAAHPSRANIPVKSIFFEVAGDRLLKIGADRARAADVKARAGVTGGSTQGAAQGTKSYKDMPLSEFEKELNEAKLRG